jgi:cytochrome P450
VKFFDRIFNKSKVARRALARSPADARDRLLFVFGGASHNWRGPGVELYRQEALFRRTVDSAEAPVIETLGFSPGAMFRGQWSPGSPTEQRRSDILSNGLLHLGVADLWAAEGIRPDGAIGLSLGEVAAAYCSGSVDREAAIAIYCSFAAFLEAQMDDHLLLVVTATIAEAEALSATSPEPLHVAGEPHPGSAVLLTRAPHADAVRAHLAGRARILAEHDTKWPYHVPGVAFDAAASMASLKDLRWQAPERPTYLASLGGRVPADHDFGPSHWSSMPAQRYRLAGASRAALADGFDCLVNIGAASIGQWVLAAAPPGAAIRLVDATPPESGSGAWKAPLRTARAATGRDEGPAMLRRGLDIDLTAPQALADPFAVYEALRQVGPVQYLRAHDFWIVLDAELVKAAFADTTGLSNAIYREVGPVLMAADPPAHREVRRLTARFLSVEAIDTLRASAAATYVPPGRFDVVSDFARPLAHRMAADLLGFPAETRADLAEAAGLYRVRRDIAEYVAVLDRLAGEAAACAALKGESGVLLDDREARQLVRFLWMAATETVERAIARTALTLLERTDLRERLPAQAGSLSPLVEEVLRLHPPELMVPRVARHEARIGGVEIPAGARVMLCLAAANRDPVRFPRPAEIDLGRRAARHFSFGAGIHRCSGMALARALVPEAVARLFSERPALRADEPLDTLPHYASLTVHTPERLLVDGGP